MLIIPDIHQAIALNQISSQAASITPEISAPDSGDCITGFDGS
ncbi:hypothetical protein PN488_19130 [Nodularia spumigena CS-591/12]|nr:hypothetical protein [Nodularia spumigena]MDB9306453.1 hypothetical protein [Nodularia spumigena CS-591/12]